MDKSASEIIAEMSHEDIREYFSKSYIDRYIFLDCTVFACVSRRIDDKLSDEADRLIEERIRKEKICL